jgi:hypothetical protein
MKMCDTKPCASCPWIKANPTTGEDIPNFSIELMRNLANTVPPRGSDQNGYFTIMACHKSKEGQPFACAGYMGMVGPDNINARLLVAQNKVDVKTLFDNCDKMDLYQDFYEMLDDYEAAQ